MARQHERSERSLYNLGSARKAAAVAAGAADDVEFVPVGVLGTRRGADLSCCRRLIQPLRQAPAPSMPTPPGRAAQTLLAHLLVSKYCDHLPLYRSA